MTLSRDGQLAPSQFMFSQLLSTVDVPHSPSASHISPTGTPVQFAMMSRASLVGHSARSTLFKQTPQLSYPASQREHGKAADEENASNSRSGAAAGGRILVARAFVVSSRVRYIVHAQQPIFHHFA